MGSTARTSSFALSDETVDTLHLSVRTRVTRRTTVHGAHILKQPLGPGAAERLRHERTMLARLVGVPGVLEPMPDAAAPGALVFADQGGIVLSTLLAMRRLEPGEVMRLGLALTRIVAGVHRRGVVHKDINPANIVMGTGPLEAWLIDYDLASVYAEERPGFMPLSELSGKLPYMAPEQTGRTGRVLDARADLYSLGATLYAAATGRPPFQSEDSRQLVHQHLASVPLAPAAVDPHVPHHLSRIVMRLLEKEPDARYQSAAGLLFDLRKAYEHWLEQDSTVFALGEQDFPERLRPPSRLFGRELELTTLRQQFDEVAHGACAMVLISGAPGVGKSALIDDVRGWVTAAGGVYAAGKFDALQQNGDADGVRQALRGVLRLLLAEPESQLEALRARLRQALGINTALAVTLLPELAHLLQTQGTVASVALHQSHTSLQQIMQLILRTLARPGCPIVLVVDDLQWAPRAALDMLDAVHLDEDMRAVMVLGSYRHNEVDAAHPLSVNIARWKRLGLPPRELHLENLAPTALAGMVSECLRLPQDKALGLADAMRELTGGNPFDTLELLDSLRRDGVLRLESTGWCWDAERIRQQLTGRNVEALVTQRLAAIPAATARLLDVMACVGGQVSLARLAVASGEDEASMEGQLVPALQDGLLVMDRAHATVQVRHDRILTALVARLPSQQRAGLQIDVARRLAAVSEHAGIGAEAYLQVIDLLQDPAECIRVAALFGAAAAQARLTVNWAQIERYAREGLGLLARSGAVTTDPAIREQHLRLASDHHAALYCLGRLPEADTVYAQIVAIATDPLQRAEASWAQISSLTQRDRPGDAVDLALDLLRDLGLEVPASPAGFEAAIATDIEELYDWLREDMDVQIARPECRDPRALAIARTLNRSCPAGYYSDHLVMSWMVMAAARLWRIHGAAAALIGPLSHSAFVTIALKNDYRRGHDIVRRVLDVAAARAYELDGAQARFIYSLSAAHWAHPLEHGVAEARGAQELLLRAGELHFGYGAYYSVLPNLVDCAATLEELETVATTAVEASRRVGNQQAGSSFMAYRQLARSLRGTTFEVGAFSDETFDEEEHLRNLADNPVGMVNHRIARALAALVAGRFGDLVAQMEAVRPLLQYCDGTYLRASGHLLLAMSLAHQARAAAPAERSALIDEFEQEHLWVAARAADCPENFMHLLRLLDAECAWIHDDFRAAALAYDEAWQFAADRTRPWHRAIILEQAARFRQAYGMHRLADLLLQRARMEYFAWGAEAKCAAMSAAGTAELHSAPQIARGAGTHLTGSATGGEIDLLAMLKAAQQLQIETEPERLMDNVCTVLSALSGASAVRIALWSEESGTWFFDTKTESGERRQVGYEQAVEDRLLPAAAFRYAQRTREPLVIDDALTDERFRRDRYFAGLKRCSLLLVPVLSRGVLRAMLVLENRRAKGMFAAHRLDGVMLIASQLATSLENALLAESLERRVAQRVQHLDADNERLTQLSETDALTGLANRRRLDAELPRMVAAAAQRGELLTVAMIDVDHFKSYNDRYGHQSGDDCLIRIAQLLRQSARDSDLVARYGGEEFAMVLPRTDLESAVQVAERARALLQAQGIAHAGSEFGVVTLSMGLASMTPRSAEAATALLPLADGSLYAAKGKGRNRVEGARVEHDIAEPEPPRTTSPQKIHNQTASGGS